MRVGTKSILFGAHQFLIHPFFVGLAWWKLYGIPVDPRLWIAFFVHDLGYLWKPNMDGIEGDKHVELGARIMRMFGKEWHDLCLYHSRFYAKKNHVSVSKLCIADKLSIVLNPTWLYIFSATLSGEIWEYIELTRVRPEAGEGKYSSMNVFSNDRRQWHRNVKGYIQKWVEEHKDGKEDTWTPEV